MVGASKQDERQGMVDRPDLGSLQCNEALLLLSQGKLIGSCWPGGFILLCLHSLTDKCIGLVGRCIPKKWF